MRTLATLTLAIVCAVSLSAAPVMTRFSPATDGFRFGNTFVNDFIPALDIHTEGLCGGMTYTVLDYFNARRQIPNQDYRPANGTPLQGHLYNRQVHSITSNLDKWAEVGFNPGGARNSEFFRWGLEGKPGGRIDELKSLIDRGVPAPLGLQSADGKSGNHQVLAIGYDMGRYRGDLGTYQGDFKIFICDPNYPTRTLRLAPDLANQIWVEQDGSGATIADTGWQTYFVDSNYHAKSPPRIVNPHYPPDGKIYQLILTFQTGADDLRGGHDNVNLTVNQVSGASEFHPNINLGARWIANYRETECVVLRTPVLPSQIKNLVLSTRSAGGLAGDNWDMLYVAVRAKGGGTLDLPRLAQAGFHRFTGASKRITVPVRRPASPIATANQLRMAFHTGSDDLRGGSDNVNVTVTLRGGGLQTFNNVNNSQRWGDHSNRTVLLRLRTPVPPGDITAVTISTTFRGGMGGDNWNMDSVYISAEGAGGEAKIGDYGRKRFTGDDKVLRISHLGGSPMRVTPGWFGASLRRGKSTVNSAVKVQRPSSRRVVVPRRARRVRHRAVRRGSRVRP